MIINRMTKRPSDRPERSNPSSNPLTRWHAVPTAAARRFHQVCVGASSTVLSGAGITPLQHGALIHLNKQTGSPGIEQSVLAARLNLDRNTASVLVEQLVKKGLVARQVSGTDRRARLLNLTAKGERIYAELHPAFLAANADVLAPLAPNERKNFMDLLVRLIEGNLARQSSAASRRTGRKSSRDA